MVLKSLCLASATVMIRRWERAIDGGRRPLECPAQMIRGAARIPAAAKQRCKQQESEIAEDQASDEAMERHELHHFSFA